MLVRCKLIRKGGTVISMADGTEYHFRPERVTGNHVADVTNKAHLTRLLGITEGYELHDPHATLQADVAEIVPKETPSLAQDASETEILEIAEECHERNRDYCARLGVFSLPSWSEAPAWMKESVADNVKNVIDNPDMTPKEAHSAWMIYKEREGWVFGPEKSEVLKTHPGMMPWEMLPEEQRRKDEIFVETVREFLFEEPAPGDAEAQVSDSTEAEVVKAHPALEDLDDDALKEVARSEGVSLHPRHKRETIINLINEVRAAQ